MTRLMAKKRAAQETDGQEDNRRSKRREDIGASTSTVAATRTKRVVSGRSTGRSTSQAGPSTSRSQFVEGEEAVDLGKFARRRVCFERYVNQDLFANTDEVKWLITIGWNPIFTPYKNANAKTVRHFYASIRNPNIKSLTFDLAIRNSLIPFKVTDIERISGVPRGTVIVRHKDSKRSKHRDERTVQICGEPKNWVQDDNCLKVTRMLPVYRFLHLVFTYNVYPRTGNHTQLTQYMLEVLYLLGTRKKVCYPSIVMRHILNAATTKTNLSLPFGRLVCKMANDCGFPFTPNARLEPQSFIDASSIKRMKLNEEEEVERGDKSEEEEEEDGEEEEEEEDNDEDIDEDFVAPPLIHERFSRVEDQLSSVQSELTDMRAEMRTQMAKQEKWNEKIFRTLKEVLCCVQKDGAAPHLTDSQDH